MSGEGGPAYERLAALAERQTTCLRGGDLDGFEALAQEAERLVDALRASPGAPRGGALDAARRALASGDDAMTILLAARERVRGELGELARSGARLWSYAAPAPPARVLDRRA
jgi:HAMP domain-containing protein